MSSSRAMPRSLLQVLLAITVLLGAGYYLAPVSGPGTEVNDREQALPKTYLVKARTWTYNEVGDLSDVLETDRATYYSTRRESVLESPRMYSHNLNNDTWSASANTGRYWDKRQVLTLSDNVVLTNDSNQVALNTQEMKINLQKNTAISKVPVTISNGANRITADSMFADLDAQIVRLKPNVQSVYIPPPKPVINDD